MSHTATSSRNPENTDASIREIHRQLLARAAEKGYEDGTRCLPAANDPMTSPFELELHARYQAQVENNAAEAGRRLQEHEHQVYRPLCRELSEHTEATLAREQSTADAEYAERRAALENGFLDELKELLNTHAVVAAQNFVDAQRQHFLDIAAGLGRYQPNYSFQPWKVVLFLGLIGVGELAFNYNAFLMLRDTGWQIALMTVALASATVLLAHFTGKFLRQAGERRVNYVLATVLAAVMIAFSYEIAVWRMNYMQNNPDVPRSIVGASFELFLSTALIFYIAGTMVSYLGHDSSLAFITGYKRLGAAERRLKIVKRRLAPRVQALKAAHTARTNQLLVQYETATAQRRNLRASLRRAISEAVGAYNQTLHQFRGTERWLEQAYLQAVQRYRDYNLTHRTNHAQPVAWQSAPPPLIPRLQQHPELHDALTLNESGV